MFYASSHLVLIFKWGSYLLKNRQVGGESEGTPQLWLKFVILGSMLTKSPLSLVHSLEFGGTHNASLAGISAAMCYSMPFFFASACFIIQPLSPVGFSRTLATQCPSSMMSSSAEFSWVVWGGTGAVQLPWPAHGPHYKDPEGIFLDHLTYFSEDIFLFRPGGEGGRVVAYVVSRYLFLLWYMCFLVCLF